MVVEVARDISQRREMQDKLKESEEQYRGLVQNSVDAIISIDSHMKICLWNSAAEKLFGYTETEIMGKDVNLIVPEKYRKAKAKGFLQFQQSGTGPVIEKTLELTGLTKEGKEIPIELSVSVRKTKAGYISMAIIRDITERKESEKQLRLEQQMVQKIFSAAPAAMILIDEKRNIEIINKAMASLIGKESEAMLHVPLGVAFNCKNLKTSHGQICGQTESCSLCPLHSVITRALQDGESIHGEEIRLDISDTKISRSRWLRISAETIDQDGRQHLMLAIYDITNQKILETQLRQDDKMRTIGQLAAGIAHEINTPSQYINDNLHFLQQSFQDLVSLLRTYDPSGKAEKKQKEDFQNDLLVEKQIHSTNLSYLTKEIPEAIQESIEGVSNIAHIVQALKQLSHPDTYEKQLVAIDQVIDNAITVSRNLWKYVAEIWTDYDPDIPLVICMPEKILQVLLNLIVNARDAIEEVIDPESDEKGQIGISTRKVNNMAEIRISDNGPGIPESIRERIFEPFFTTKEIGKGSGQGLGICYAILVEEHGGSIEVETEEGKGTTFILRLPLTE